MRVEVFIFDEVSASWSQYSNLSISRHVLRLFEVPQNLLLLFSYLSVSRFSSKGFQLLLDI